MQHLPLKKLTGIALFTSPLLGLLGTSPVLITGRLDIYAVSQSFLFITLMTLVCWVINVGLLKAGQRFDLLTVTWVRYLFSITFSMLLLVLLFKLVMPPPPKIFPAGFTDNQVGAGLRKRPFIPFISAQSLNIIVLFMLDLVLLQSKKQQIESENNQLRMSNLEARNNQLRQQLHPHFLFNSLNALKALIKRSPDQAEDYLVRLSDLLRYSVGANTQTMISLREEMELSLNYLSMQQVRFRNALQYHVNVPEEMKDRYVLPVFSIQSLAENAIKHNVLTSQRPLHIHIDAGDGDDTIVVSNNCQAKTTETKSSGLGLKNLAERYRLSGHEGLFIDVNEISFSVTLKMFKHEDSDNRR